MATQQLSQKKCQPCEGIGKPLIKDEAEAYLKEIAGWNISDDDKVIYREFVMKNFMAAVHFINRIASVAESENHHPDLYLKSYRKLRVELSTHAIGGLSENDFILASKINELPAELKTK